MCAEFTQVIWPTPRSSRDVEILEVREQQLLRRLVIRPRGGEDLLAQLLERDVGDARHALGHTAVALGAGGDLNMTVSETMAAAIMPASFSEGMRPFS